jgi:hypothetical protein
MARTKYPYERWTDGENHIIEQGKDFFCTVPSMKAALHFHARTNGMAVRTQRIGETQLEFRFIRHWD